MKLFETMVCSYWLFLPLILLKPLFTKFSSSLIHGNRPFQVHHLHPHCWLHVSLQLHLRSSVSLLLGPSPLLSSLGFHSLGFSLLSASIPAQFLCWLLLSTPALNLGIFKLWGLILILPFFPIYTNSLGDFNHLLCFKYHIHTDHFKFMFPALNSLQTPDLYL